jgi:PBSX family phage terminase large subunit
MSSKPNFVWKTPSPTQEQILYWWWPGNPYANCSYIELEGAVRSGKTITASYSFINWASYTFDQEDLALCSKTIGTCLRNIVRPLKRILSEEPNYEVKEYRASAEGHRLEVTDIGLDHTNSFFVYGGKDESSQDLIQGKTLAGALADEVLLYPLSFLNQLLSRTSVENSKVWFTFNPTGPTDPMYSEILDPYVADGRAYYLHLTMDDNPDLSEEARTRIESQWPVGSVWHSRNVLGKRVTAEGAIFPFFNDRPENGFVIDKLPTDFNRWIVSGDYGQDHPTTYGLYGYSPSLASWVMVKEYYDRMKTNVEYSTDFGEFIKWDGKDLLLEEVDIDPGGGGLSLITQLRTDYPQLADRGIINHAIKVDVNSELQDLASALYTHKFRYYSGCKRSIIETANYRWNEKSKKSGKEEPLKENDDGPSRDRYAWNRIMRLS